eukprot:SAG31_NODE_22584_length_522_cov_1.092199_1_plen_20_part_01
MRHNRLCRHRIDERLRQGPI